MHLRFITLLVALVSIIWGCAGDEALLKDPRFEGLGKEKVWSVEGDGVFKKSAEGIELRSGQGAPFVYQQVRVTKKLRGGMISLAAWVKADVSDAIVVEFSNRLGTDEKSEAHPGDGQWRLLKLTARVPENSDIIEFRVRGYKRSAAFIKDVSMTTGSFTKAERDAGAVELSGLSRAAAVAFLLLLSAMTVWKMRSRNESLHMRLLWAFLLLIFLANLMLILRPRAAEVASNIAWVIFALSAILYMRSKVGFGGLFKRTSPGALLAAASVCAVFVTANSLMAGAEGFAGKTAKAAYLLMISSALAHFIQRLYIKFWVSGYGKKAKVYRKDKGQAAEVKELIIKEDA